MADGIAKKRDPQKWAQAKARAKAKMGGKHSARAMQLATKYYKDSGGKYEGKKPSAKNNKMKKWTKEDWGTKSGKNSTEGKNATGERYLPSAAIKAMSSSQYAASSAKKRKDKAAGKQHSKQPKAAARISKRYR